MRRCPTCNRWGGARRVAADGRTVELDPDKARGQCNEGPWHGSMRGPRNACGQWVQWIEIRSAESANPTEPKASARLQAHSSTSSSGA
ncbi:MAG: hypothetical protein J0M28_00430 [Thauera sp.]|nr:hypothetical protein [Thauera sp.]